MMSSRCRTLLSLALLSFVLWTPPVGAQPALVKDINVFPQSFDPSGFAAIGNIVYFTALNDGHGSELWRSDGTAAGTVLVKDIRPGSGGSSPSDLTNVNGVLYFAAANGANGRELWRSNGTAAGTVLVKDIEPGSGGSSPSELTVAFNDCSELVVHGILSSDLFSTVATQNSYVFVRCPTHMGQWRHAA